MSASQSLCVIMAMVLAPIAAADSAPASAVVPLKDGRTLHSARVIDSGAGWVTLRSDEGIFKVAASDLPAGMAVPLAPVPRGADAPPSGMVFERFDPNQEPISEAPPPAQKPAVAVPKPAAAAADQTSEYRGCEIASFEPKEVQGVQGCAVVVIRNSSFEGVVLRPGEISCTIAGGGRRPGRFFFSDTVPVSVLRREVVPAHGELTVIVTFANTPLDITAVLWSR